MIWLAAPDPKLDRRCFIVRGANGQALAYVYFEEEQGRRSAANLLTRDEARSGHPTHSILICRVAAAYSE